MTIETCKKQLAAAKTPEEKAYWQARIDRKIARYPKYAALKVVEPVVEDKPKLKRSKDG